MSVFVTAKDGMGSITETGSTFVTTGMQENDIMHAANDLVDNAGVVDLDDTGLEVTENGTPDKSVDVAKGICYVSNSSFVRADGTNTKYWRVENTATENVSISDNASGNPRIDIICVKVDTAATPDDNASNVASIVVVEGTPAASPSVPATPNNHLKLAEVAVANGFTSITNANITDSRAYVYVQGVRFDGTGSVFTDYVQVADDKDIKFASGAKIERSGGHIVLTPESNKFVKVAVLRQDDTTNSYENNSVVLTGWGYIQGNGSSNNLSEAVTFGITFSGVPLIVCSGAGQRSNSNPSSFDQLNAISGSYAQLHSPSTTGFIVDVLERDSGAIAATLRIGYSWAGFGQLN